MVLNEKESFEAVAKFCYLGDMLSPGGEAATAISTSTPFERKKVLGAGPNSDKQTSEVACNKNFLA